MHFPGAAMQKRQIVHINTAPYINHNTFTHTTHDMMQPLRSENESVKNKMSHLSSA